MTGQHFFYIPTIFLLGFVLGSVANGSAFGQKGELRYGVPKKTLLLTLFFFLLVFVITHIFEIPGGSRLLAAQLGGAEIFDKRPVFSSSEVYERVRLFPASGIMAYKRFTYTIDILFPVSFFVFLLTFARFVAQRVPLRKYLQAFLISLPVLWLAFDLLENAVIFMILSLFPDESEFAGGSLGFITVAKFALLLLSILTPFLVIIGNKLKAHAYRP